MVARNRPARRSYSRTDFLAAELAPGVTRARATPRGHGSGSGPLGKPCAMGAGGAPGGRLGGANTIWASVSGSVINTKNPPGPKPVWRRRG